MKNEIDIWLQVLESNGYKFYDELSKSSSETNILKFQDYKNAKYHTLKGMRYYSCEVYFNLKTGKVSNIYFSDLSKEEKHDVLLKSEFELRLRDSKLDNILNY